jgi:hypothetical protein
MSSVLHHSPVTHSQDAKTGCVPLLAPSFRQVNERIS